MMPWSLTIRWRLLLEVVSTEQNINTVKKEHAFCRGMFFSITPSPHAEKVVMAFFPKRSKRGQLHRRLLVASRLEVARRAAQIPLE